MRPPIIVTCNTFHALHVDNSSAFEQAAPLGCHLLFGTFIDALNISKKAAHLSTRRTNDWPWWVRHTESTQHLWNVRWSESLLPP